MSIEFTPLHNELHAYRDGSVLIDIPFEGNLLALEVTTKPEYLLSRQVIGTLYQMYGSVGKGYTIYSGKDILRLDLPQTEKLWFSPTSFLSDTYTLDLSYALVGSFASESNSALIPEQVLGLPIRVSTLEDNTGEILELVDTLSSVDISLSNRVTTLEGSTSSPSWEDIADKPVSFTPASHNHSISEVTGLTDALTGKAGSSHTHAIIDISGLSLELDTINTDVANLTDRVETLEGSTPSGSSINTTQEITLALNGSITITAKEILGIYKVEPLIGQNLIPTMSSNTTPSPLVASTNGTAGTGAAWNAFDKNLTDRGWLSNAQTGGFVQIDMGVAITADTLSCLVRAASVTSNEFARKLTLVTSNNGATWSAPLVAVTNWSPVGGVFSDFSFTQTTARYWRLFCEDRPSGYPAVNEMSLSLSTGSRYTNVLAQYAITKLTHNTSTGTDVFTITKTTSGTEKLVITYL